MTPPPSPPRPLAWRRLQGWRLGLAALLAIAVAIAAYGLAGWWFLLNWLDEDARLLRPLEHVIVHEGRRLPASSSPLDLQLDEALLTSQGSGRDVRAFSRSLPRTEPFGRFQLVKVHLETGLPGDPDRTVPIKFAVRFRHRAGKVEILRVDTLGL